MRRLLAILFLLTTISICVAQGSSELIHIPDQMPVWKSCDNLKESEKHACTNKEIFTWISEKLYIPKSIKFEDLSGTRVYVKFIISELGEVKKVEILKGVHFEVDEIVFDLVKSMPEFIPAEEKGVNVSFTYNLPIQIEIK